MDRNRSRSTAGSVCIIGAGLAGLSAAYDLGRHGHDVIVLEASEDIGGLASSILLDGRIIERFYHFICTGDSDLIQFINELGIGEQLHWLGSKTSFYYEGDLYDFGSPVDLVRFNPIPFLQRIRFGLNIIDSRFRTNWLKLDQVSAKSWLIQQIGRQAYNVIWDPLLRVKFGDFHDQVSAAWIWHRIHRVATSRRRLWEGDYLGYLENGSDSVISATLNHLREMPNVEIRTGTRVDRVLIEGEKVRGVQLEDQNEELACSYVISTIALSLLPKIASALPIDFMSKINQIDYLGVICGLLKLRQPLTDSFWVNINDSQIPFNGFIEYSNLNQHLDIGSKGIVYIPYYISTSNPRFSYSDDRLISEFINGLQCIRPDFNESWIEDVIISRASNAQAVCTINFTNLVLPHQTPVEGLFITDSSQYYPEYRTISAAIRLGRRVAYLIQMNDE